MKGFSKLMIIAGDFLHYAELQFGNKHLFFFGPVLGPSRC
jgi:hypothetical protein